MKRLAIDTKGSVQMISNDTYFADMCFSFVKTADDAMAAGVNYCGPAKTSHKGVFLATLEKLMKDFPVGSYIFMKSTPIFTGGRPLLSIGYKYNSRKVLGFIATEGAGVLNQVIPIYLVYLIFILMFLFALLFVLAC